jgi:TonB family protein
MDRARPRCPGSCEGKVGRRRGYRAPSLAAALILLAGAAPPPDPVPPRKPGWAIDYGAQRCALVRTGEGEDPLTLAIRMIPGHSRPEVILARRDWRDTRLIGARTVTFVMVPSGRVIEAQALWVPNRLGLGDILQLDGLPDDFIDAFAGAAAVELRNRGKTVLNFPVPAAARAVRALRDCNTALLAAWGVDAEALAALRRQAKPIGDLSGWTSDYPHVALGQSISGTVVVRLDVSAAGAVTGCAAVAGSGSLALDSQTCTSFLRRGRFEPALGADGKPVAISIVQTVIWMVGR